MENLEEVRDWLKTQEVERDIYKSHKSALLRSTDPFGLFACYKDDSGVEYWYLNGKLDSVELDGETIRYN